MPDYFGLLIIIVIGGSLMGIMFIIQLFYDYYNKYNDDEDNTNGEI